MGGNECAAVGTFCMESLKTPGLYYCAKPGSTPPGNPTAPDAGPPSNPTTPPATDTAPPQIAINSPAAMATVAATLTVQATASDNVGVARVELLVDGALLAMRSSAPWEFPIVLKAGSHTLKAVAYDGANNKGEASVTVTVQGSAPPSTPPSTSPTETPPKGSGTYGDACSGPSQCQTSLCARDELTQTAFCTQACVPGSAPCPVGSECLAATGASYVCAPAATGAAPVNLARPGATTQGGCAIGGAPADSCPALVIIGMLLVVRRRSGR